MSSTHDLSSWSACRHAAAGVLIAVMFFFCLSCGSSSSGPPPTPTPTPTPTPLAECGVPAPANPAGGGGTSASIVVDPAAWGKGDMSGFTVYGFSQVNPGDPADQEVLTLAPDMVPRAWGKWDLDGTQPQDYNFDYIVQAHQVGTTLIGGTTASVLFRDEFGPDADFMNVVSCDASGQPVLHNTGGPSFYRATMASPAYRQYLVNIGKIQIDGGAEGLFYDEIDSWYGGATYNGNEGFDNADVADFGGFLCAKYPSLTAADWASRFDIAPQDHLDCTLGADQRGRGFDYRGYLARHGWQNNPLAFANPLAPEWGTTVSGHPDFRANSFVQTYPSLVYWQDVVLQLRTYARQTYGREILITANGIFPFADFQSVGLWDYNPDGPGGSSEDYVPLVNGHLDGTVSWLDVFQGFQDRSQRVAGRTVPVSIFLDWPTGNMDRYYSLTSQERQDYLRMFTAEAYASGLYFALPLRTSMPGDPTAIDLGLMPLFGQLRNFYKSHASLYQGASMQRVAAGATNGGNIAMKFMQLPDGSTVVHLINHNYAVPVDNQSGIETRSNVSVSFLMASEPQAVTLVSPDQGEDQLLSFSYSNGSVQVTVPQLASYAAIVAK